MKRDLFELAGTLSRRGVSFVVATVVRRDGKSSAHQGDMALVTAEGEFHGWIGGGCTRPTVEREAKIALTERKPRLICLSPLPDRELRPGLLALPMSCHSGGTVEIYLDPVIATPRLVLLGRSPIISALAALGRGAGYRVDVADPEVRADEVPGADRVLTSFEAPELRGETALPGEPPRDAAPLLVVVATMGEHDEEAVLAALALAPSYLGVVASRPRFAILRETLLARGVSAAALDAIASPAGLALGARGPGEVAISILAQIVAHLHGIAGSELAPPTPRIEATTATTATTATVTTPALQEAPTSPHASGAALDPAAAASAEAPALPAAPAGPATPAASASSASPASSAPGSSSSPKPRRLPMLGAARFDAMAARPDEVSAGAAAAPQSGDAVDPVCLMTVTIAKAVHVGTWDDRPWYFCCAGCKQKFLANPGRYLVVSASGIGAVRGAAR